MVIENRRVIAAISRLVGSIGVNWQENHLQTDTQDAENEKSVQEGVDGLISKVSSSAELIQLEKRSKRERLTKRTRQVSECASLLVAPSQEHEKPPGCLKWRVWLPSIIRIPCVILSLYLFICSLELLSTSFRLIAGKTAGSIFHNNTLLTNPVVGLMVGVMFTVLVQSSSTCTSVIVSMVSSGILDVKYAVPMIMGANIGTSLTNTLVSFTQAAEVDEFERAFAGATVHDCFNWLTVTVMLTLEVTTGYLYNITRIITNSGIFNQTNPHAKTSDTKSKFNFLSTLTKPLTSSVVQINKPVLKCWALGECQEERLLKVWCKAPVTTTELVDVIDGENIEQKTQLEKCPFLLNSNVLSDRSVGIILFIISLLTLSMCLIFLVKLLHSLLQGAVADMAKKTINSDIPHFPWLTGYVAILMGAILTFFVQSSSVFTSTLTPLVGCGLISVERMYPLTLGSNIGTTTTAMLAAMAAEPSMLKSSIQIALVHLFFNLHGIALFYPVSWMRWPLAMCKTLGKTTAKYRWFAILYLLVMFFVLPALVLCLSLLGRTVFLIVILPLIWLLLIVILINILQNQRPAILPELLRTWSFLPVGLRSLDPLDRLISRIGCCRKYSNSERNEETEAYTDICDQRRGSSTSKKNMEDIESRSRVDFVNEQKLDFSPETGEKVYLEENSFDQSPEKDRESIENIKGN